MYDSILVPTDAVTTTEALVRWAEVPVVTVSRTD